MIKVKYYSYKTGKLIRESNWSNTTYNKVMVSLFSIEHKYIIGNGKDDIEVYIQFVVNTIPGTIPGIFYLYKILKNSRQVI